VKKLSSIPRLSREDLANAPEWVDQLLAVSNDFQEQATQRINEDLILGQHARGIEFVHGIERRIRNPYGSDLEGIDAIRCIGIDVDSAGKPNGGTFELDVAGLRWRHIQSRPGEPSLVGVTLLYDLAHTEPMLIRTASATQNVANNTLTDMTGWNTTETSRGAVISDDGTTFTVTEAGTYAITLAAGFTGGSTYSAADVWIDQGGTARAENYLPAPFTDGPLLTTSTVLSLAAGGTFKARAFQTNAATATRTLRANRRITIHRLCSDETPRGRVTLRFDGGN
jgi:hypothetical protein